MSSRYALTRDAARDLVRIWKYNKKAGGAELADRLEAAIRDKILFLVRNPNAGHRREDLTSEPVRFLASHPYLIVYDPESNPLTVVAVVHGSRDVERLLSVRL